MYYVYVLKNNRGELYYGYTNNFDRRVLEHNKDQNQELIYYEAYKSEQDARRRERKLKDYGQAVKALKSRISQSLK